MKGKWAAGISPRNFAWIIKDRLAVSERPGGYARTHRRVRRQEEIIWIREQGFTRVISLLASPHNLHAYEELALDAALRGGRDRVYDALLAHPLVGQADQAQCLTDRLLAENAAFLPWT